MTNDDGEARRTTAKRGKEGKQSVRSYGYMGVTMLKGRTWRDKREEILGEERATLLGIMWPRQSTKLMATKQFLERWRSSKYLIMKPERGHLLACPLVRATT
jgi:hypothetical protein